MDEANKLLERIKELEAEGYSHNQAFGIANMERSIEQWPSSWEDDLQILLYGDFEAPNATLEYPEFGITIFPEKLENTVITSALCVLKAKAKINEKSLVAIYEAIRRINIFLGLWSLKDWGNCTCHWWCHVTAGSISGASSPLDNSGLKNQQDQ